MQEGWEEGGLAVVVVARDSGYDRHVVAAYVVDLYCLGVKNTLYKTNIQVHELDRTIEGLTPAGRPVVISADLAHEIIYGALEYAAKFGFEPHRDFAVTRRLLDPPDTHPRSGDVEFGREGKPFYVSGPSDDPRAIIEQLMRTAGEGNFDYLVQGGEPVFGAPPTLTDG